jgi:transcriptional regulator with XRE-family HTH domain
MSPATLIRTARHEAGLTQADLASRLGTTQSAIARLERPGSNPTVATLESALAAAGRRLDLSAHAALPEVDEGQILRHLRMTPTERIRAHDAAHRNVAALVRKARRVPRDDLVD